MVKKRGYKGCEAGIGYLVRCAKASQSGRQLVGGYLKGFGNSKSSANSHQDKADNGCSGGGGRVGSGWLESGGVNYGASGKLNTALSFGGDDEHIEINNGGRIFKSQNMVI